MHQLLSDLRYCLRMLRKTPVVTLVAVLSLGVGIAANTTTFSIAKAFLFETFRWPSSERITVVWETRKSTAEDVPVAPGNYLAWRDAATRFAGLEAYEMKPANLTGGERPEQINIVAATPGLLDLIGRAPTVGRGFSPEEKAAADGHVAILTWHLFRDRFSGDPAALGRTVFVDGEPLTVIGVLPEDFDFFPANVELFRLADLEPRRQDHETRELFVLGRLADGATRDEAAAELAAVSQRLEAEHPDTNRGFGVHAQTLRELFPGETDSRLQYIFLTVAMFVLLIACANLVNVFLARADARQTELALRSALGGGRLDVTRQILFESVLIALLGGVGGILFSIWGVQQLAAAMPALLPSVFVPRLDAAVLVYGLVVSLMAGLVLGAAPALQAARVQPAAVLGETSRGGTGSRRRRRLRAGFIVAETAVALGLLTAAGVLSDTFNKWVRENGAMQVDGVLTLDLTADAYRFPEDPDAVSFFEEVERRLTELPGVESVTALSFLPRGYNVLTTPFQVEGHEPVEAAEAPQATWQAVSPDFFTTLGVPLRSGRALAITDRADTAPVVVVSESLARRYLGDRDPLGQRIEMFDRSWEVVGVSADFVQTRIILDEGVMPGVFVPLSQHPVRSLSLAARVGGDPALVGDPMQLAESAREAVWAVDPDQPVSRVQTLRHHIETDLAGPIMIANVLTIMGTLALILSAIGMYGLIAYDVSQRRREIGIRMALGAAPRSVVGRVTLQGVGIAGVGILLGLPLAWAMVRAIEAALQGIVPVSFTTVLVVMAVLATVAFVASGLPALRASRIRPAQVLQVE